MAHDRMSEFLSMAPHLKQNKVLYKIPPIHSSNNIIFNNWLPINDETEPIFKNFDEIQRLRKLHESSHVVQLVDSRPETREHVRSTLEKFRIKCHSCQEMIIAYNQITQELEQGKIIKGYNGLNLAELRMRRNIVSFMESKLMTEVRNLWMQQKMFEERLIEVTARRVKVRFPYTYNNNDNNELTKMNIEEARDIAKQLVLSGNEDQLFSLARDELERVMRTRDAVFEIEREMQEILVLFSDLNFIVKEQHTTLVKVQENVEKSNRNIEAGGQYLTEAKNHQKSCCTMF